MTDLFHFAMENTRCDVCEKSFYSRGNLKVHKTTVHGSKRYQCPLCIKRFTTDGSRLIHVNNLHSEEYNQKRLEKEIERKKHAYECDTCKKRFRDITHLTQHIQAIHTSKYFQCPKCIRRFRWKSNLYAHVMYTHATSDLRYETSCLNGMEQWKLMVDECIPNDIMPQKDLHHIQLYMDYVKNKSAVYKDVNVDYT